MGTTREPATTAFVTIYEWGEFNIITTNPKKTTKNSWKQTS